MKNLEISLLLSTYQKPWHLRRALTSIAEQEGVRDRMELVVADDGSTDETPRVVHEFGRSAPFPVSFVTHPHETFQLARCRNEAVAASKADYLLFLDGDCVLPPDHVIQHLRHRRPNRVMGGFCCRLDEQTTNRFDDEAIRSRKYLEWIPRSELRILARRDFRARIYRLIHHSTKPKLGGGNIGIWRRDYERVNGYDENFEGWGGEDDDLRLRLRKAGIQIESILRWTRTYHLWHPRDVTAPPKKQRTVNRAYLDRKRRLIRCTNGLVKRGLAELETRVVGRPLRAASADSFLKSHGLTVGDADRAEVELLFLPGEGRFSGRADCNVLIVLEDAPRTARMARMAHVVLAVWPYPEVLKERCFQVFELERALGAAG